MPALVDAALAHYQFETIHPFPDGNGRVGRMLITLILIDRGVLSQPLLYLSPYFESHKDQYIDLLFEVSRTGAWNQWISFFLRGVIDSCSQTISIADRLLALQKAYRERLQKSRSSTLILRIIDLAFERPVRSVTGIAEALNVSYQGASNNIRILLDEGIARDIGSRYPRLIIFPEIIDCVHS